MEYNWRSNEDEDQRRKRVPSATRLGAENGILYGAEVGQTKKVLSAAALTYVAAAAASILQLLRLILLFGRRDNDQCKIMWIVLHSDDLQSMFRSELQDLLWDGFFEQEIRIHAEKTKYAIQK